MKQITFKELQDLVANIDYIDDESYPVKFSVVNSEGCPIGTKNKFECGIPGHFEVDGEVFDEQQYFEVNVLNHSHKFIIDLQEPDEMVYEGIGDMLKRYCRINDSSKIYLYDKSSFTGKRKQIDGKDAPENFVAKVRESHTQFEITEEVEKGLNYLRKLVKEVAMDKDNDIMLISTKEGEIVDLNGMSGSNFAFLFDRKVLYYNEMEMVLCTYCPYNSNRSVKDCTIRIESNDNFRWILLNECTGENLLSEIKPCSIEVKSLFDGKTKVFDCINEDKMNKFFEKAYETAVKACETLSANR